MLSVVMYDISDDTSRNNLIKHLRYFGLRRIQKSVFSGFLSIDERLDLVSDFDLYISSEKDSIVLIPICESCNNSIYIEGNLVLPEKLEYTFV